MHHPDKNTYMQRQQMQYGNKNFVGGAACKVSTTLEDQILLFMLLFFV
jgi:hypothetical protein